MQALVVKLKELSGLIQVLKGPSSRMQKATALRKLQLDEEYQECLELAIRQLDDS